MQVSAHPPALAISINKENFTHELITESKKFTVSILNNDAPMSLIGTFGFKCGRTINKMEHVTCIEKEATVPIVTDYAIAYIEASLINKVDVSTHTIFIGEVNNAEMLSEAEPMTYEYYHTVKGGLSPKNAPTYVGSELKKRNTKRRKKHG